MTLADKWGKPLYEVAPDVFPGGVLTDTEMALWALFFDDQQERIKARQRKGKG